MQGKEAIQDISPAMTKERSIELQRGRRMGGACVVQRTCCVYAQLGVEEGEPRR